MKVTIDQWEAEICKKVRAIDPDQELCWQSLFIGFAIGRGTSVAEAVDPASYAEAFKREIGASD